MASAWTCSAVRILSHVASLQNRACRFQTVCQGPNSTGKSRHGGLTRNRNTIPSTTCRWSRKFLPRRPFEHGRNGSILAQSAADNTAVLDMTASSGQNTPIDGRHASARDRIGVSCNVCNHREVQSTALVDLALGDFMRPIVAAAGTHVITAFVPTSGLASPEDADRA